MAIGMQMRDLLSEEEEIVKCLERVLRLWSDLPNVYPSDKEEMRKKIHDIHALLGLRIIHQYVYDINNG